MRLGIILFIFVGACSGPALNMTLCSDSVECPSDYFCDWSHATLPVSGGVCTSIVNGNYQSDLDPITLFEKNAKPSLLARCSFCHEVAQGNISAFLTPGKEYQDIINYRMGLFLNTSVSSQSLLLKKGAHAGPALEPKEYAGVQSWLALELAFRSSAMPNSISENLIPTAPIGPGDYKMNFGFVDPINDPEAYLTFHLAPSANNSYLISNLRLTAGPINGIRIVHPRFYFYISPTSFPDQADSLAGIEAIAIANDSVSVGKSPILITGPHNDPNMRIGVTFDRLEKVPGPFMTVMCKDFADFNPAVAKDLEICAKLCHSPENDGAASSAFDMSAAISTDMRILNSLCTRTRARIFTPQPTQSILLQEVIPAPMGGIPTHPFKYSPTDLMRFTSNVSTWAIGER